MRLTIAERQMISQFGEWATGDTQRADEYEKALEQIHDHPGQAKALAKQALGRHKKGRGKKSK